MQINLSPSSNPFPTVSTPIVVYTVEFCGRRVKLSSGKFAWSSRRAAMSALTNHFSWSWKSHLADEESANAIKWAARLLNRTEASIFVRIIMEKGLLHIRAS
jgi:hypothetical protein